MERIFQSLLAAGFSKESVDWLRRHRTSTIIFLAIGAWLLFAGLIWLIVALLLR